MKYRVKTADVEAWQWDGTLPASWEGAPEWLMQAWREGRVRFGENEYGTLRMLIQTDDHAVHAIAFKDYWLVRYEDGSLTAVAPGRFAEKFEAVSAPPEISGESMSTPCGAAWPAGRVPPATRTLDGQRYFPNEKRAEDMSRVLDALRRAWERHPHMRLAQLIVNVNIHASDEMLESHFDRAALAVDN
jgi:hypothetical protein